MKAFFSNFATVTILAFKRLVAQRGLVLATTVGLIASLSLVLSIPLYADATHFRLLREEIGAASGPADYAPLGFLLRFTGPRRDGPQLENITAVDQYLSQQALSDLNLPALKVVRNFRTDTFQLFPQLDPNNPKSKYFLSYFYFSFMSEPEKNLLITTGSLPSPADDNPATPVEAIVHENAALQFGIDIGQVYFMRRDTGVEIPVRIVGYWKQAEPNAQVWDIKAEQLLLVDESSFARRVSSMVEDELLDSRWYIVMDGSHMHSGDVAELLPRIDIVARNADILQPGTKMTASPIDALVNYEEKTPSLTFLLYSFSIPIIGLIISFVGLVAGLYVNQQQNEIAIMRSRGGSTGQMVSIGLLEGLLMGSAALLISIPVGRFLAFAIGRTRSFLNFTAPAKLRVDIALILAFGIGALVLILLVQVALPTLNAARRTIITYKQERARAGKAPWWQRAWLDVLLLLPAAYGIYMLQRQSRLATGGAADIPDPLENPLLLLVPALGIFALSLLMLRLVPKIMAFMSWALRRSNSVGMLMAARYLSRTPAFYSAPLVLLVLTLSLSTFTASLAQTLDRHLYKQMHYQTGADLNLTELGTTVNENAQSAVWTFNPVEDHLLLPAITAASRVGRYDASVLRADGKVSEGVFMGIDRLTFPEVAYWQRNFSPASLGALMNALAGYPDGVLVSGEYANQQKLKIGDPITLGVKVGQSDGLTLQVAGFIDLFPTWYPEQGPLFVGNLDYLFQHAGGEFPHQVWVTTKPDTNMEDLVYAVRGYSILLDQKADPLRLVQDGLNTQVSDWVSAPVLITAEQRRPERQGLFGLLSVGFATSAFLTVMGFLLYALFSFRRRFIEMGMLRAIGLSTLQMISLLASELILLILIGIGVGTALGVWVSRMFVPYLQLGTVQTAHYPPFLVEIAWSSVFQIYGLFGLLFLVALSVLAALLRRMKIFQAIKLGETT